MGAMIQKLISLKYREKLNLMICDFFIPNFHICKFKYVWKLPVKYSKSSSISFPGISIETSISMTALMLVKNKQQASTNTNTAKSYLKVFNYFFHPSSFISRVRFIKVGKFIL